VRALTQSAKIEELLTTYFLNAVIMPRLFFVALLFLPAIGLGDDFKYFETHIRPILATRCYDCHNSETSEADLRLDLRQGLLKGGRSGPVIVPGQPSKSLLLKAITAKDEHRRMPPKDSGDRLSEQQVRHFQTWIRDGAPDPRDGTFSTSIFNTAKTHWAFQPLNSVSIPEGPHPVDYLLSRQFETKKYVPLPPANQRALIRRLSYDLLGLPPTPEQLATPDDQIDELIEQFLASPKYGERWGRHWLDVARYSDAKDGVLMYGDARIRPFAYTYRDYVIRAFNDDRPFDEFIREQLAADQLMLPADSPRLAGMGFLTLGRLFDNNIHDVIDDQIDAISRGFLGLTVSCARCHDHKFDPIPTADYYSLYGVFASSEEPYHRPRVSELTEASKPFEVAYQKKLDEISARQNTLYASTLEAARYRTTRHLVKAATTEPDNLETTIFFLSLIKDQLRPQITYAWRQYLAENAYSGHRIFGPWADMRKNPVLQPEKWSRENIEPRVIAALTQAKPETPEQIATVYGELLINAWSRRTDLEGRINTLERQLDRIELGVINLADLIAGGDGLGNGNAGLAVHPANGKTVEGSTSNISSTEYDAFFPAENDYIDGVFIPRNSSKQIVSTTGITISDAPTGAATGSWDYIRYGPSQGATSNIINGIDYGKSPNWLLGVHANKGFTVDLDAIRELHQFESGAFKTVIGHGGAIDMSTIDVSIYLDGHPRFRQLGFKAQQPGPELTIPFSKNNRFLTILITEGKDGNSHDQGILGNPQIDISGDQHFHKQLELRTSSIVAEINTLKRQLASSIDPNNDELARILLGEDSPVWFPKRKLYFYLDRQDKDSYRGLLNSLDSIAVSDPNAADRAMIMVDKSQLYDPVIFQRGDPAQPGTPVPRQFLELLSPKPRQPFTNGAGRLELANAIVSATNPLTPRVWANRVWMHHFGTPLLSDPSDFGLRNDKPIQNDLLDFLAQYLVNNNYQTKPLHRLILSSDAYRRSSVIPADNVVFQKQMTQDPDNQYYWRFTRRRLDLEQMRDTLLHVSGLLDDTMFGRPLSIDSDENNRRTIYAFVERQNLPTIIQVFDAANADSSTSKRPSTTVPQQALFALNSPFIERVTTSLTNRVTATDSPSQVQQLYHYLLGRKPSARELKLGTEFLHSNPLNNYAQVLLMSNEVWFID